MMLNTALRQFNYNIFLSYLTVLVLLSVFFLFFGHFDLLNIDGKDYLHVKDDHMITMRVAKNFADYGVPFFNHDESVAANTSLFWPIILGATVMSFSAFKAVALNILLSVFLSASTIAIATLWFKEWWLRLSAIILLAGSSSYLNYGASGWEHIPQTFFVTAGLFLVYKSSRDRLRIPLIAVIFISFSFLFRPDSSAIIAVTVLAWIFHNDNYKKSSTYFYALSLLILPLSYLLMMDYYYDSFSPNTAKLKILDFKQSLEFGFMYLVNPFQSGLAPSLLIALFFIRSKNHFSHFVLYLGVAHTVYVFLVGGDVFGHGRLFILLLPSLIFTMFAEIQRLSSRWNTKSVKMSLLSVVLLVTIFGNYSAILANSLLYTQDLSAVEKIKIMHIVNEKLEPIDGSIGLHHLGISYHIPEFHVVDFLGKAEPYIAGTPPKHGPIGHNKWDYQYAFERYNIAVVPIPDYIVRKVSDPRFSLNSRYPIYMYEDELAQLLLNSDSYVYLSPEHFDNKEFGAFVRRDLIANFNEQAVRQLKEAKQ